MGVGRCKSLSPPHLSLPLRGLNGDNADAESEADAKAETEAERETVDQALGQAWLGCSEAHGPT